MRRLLCALLIIGMPTAWGLSESLDIFTIKDVAVDAQGETAEKARAKAIAQGHRDAWVQLVKALAAEGAQTALNPPAEKFVYLVRDHEIHNELASAKRYKANLTVRFQPSAVRKYFREHKVVYTEDGANASLILPIYVVSDNKLLWHENNLWLDAWCANGAGGTALNPILIPLNDLADQHDITLQQALSHKHNDLAKIGIRYDAKNVIIAVAIANVTDYDKPQLQVTLSRIGIFDGQTDHTEFVIEGSAGEGPEDLLKRAVEKTLKVMDYEWKEKKQVHFDSVGSLYARIKIQSENDWNIIETRLREIPLIKKIVLDYINAFEVGLSFRYQGSPQNLKMAMNQFGLRLLGDEGEWYIERTEQP